MANYLKEWQVQLVLANNGLKEYNTEIQVLQDENDGTYSIDILTIGQDGTTKRVISFTTKREEDELFDAIWYAHGYVCDIEEERKKNPGTFIYKCVPGGTHELPALIWSLTDFTLYFRDAKTGAIEVVEESIDLYEDRHGDFCVLFEDYEPAVQFIEDHDERGAECD